MRFPFAIGAVVEGLPTTFQTPLSGHDCPVFASMPIGARAFVATIFMVLFVNRRPVLEAVFVQLYLTVVVVKSCAIFSLD